MPIQDFKTPSTLCYVYIIDVSVNDDFLARFDVNKVVKQSIFFIAKWIKFVQQAPKAFGPTYTSCKALLLWPILLKMLCFFYFLIMNK